MDLKERMPTLLCLLICLSFFSINIQARNCVKGKPCGNGCIAKNKTCRIGQGRSSTTQQSSSVMRRSQLILPKVYIVTSPSINATASPHSHKITGRYREGQNVFVYEIHNSWARLTNMEPNEWIKLKHLKLKK
jgi:hypothetical protein